jgi:hypothetical protein
MDRTLNWSSLDTDKGALDALSNLIFRATAREQSQFEKDVNAILRSNRLANSGPSITKNKLGAVATVISESLADKNYVWTG